MAQKASALEAVSLLECDETSNYVVYPKDCTNKDQCTAITNLLKSIVSDPTKIYISDTDGATYFWGVPLTPDNVEKIEANSNVMISGHPRRSQRTDKPRSLELLGNARRTATIQRTADDEATPLIVIVLTNVPTTKRHFAPKAK